MSPNAATHSKDFVDKLERRVIVLEDGQVVRDDKVGKYEVS